MLPNSVLLSVAAVLVGLAQAQRTQSVWGQCGGAQYSGPTQCGQNNYCSKGNEYYYQCVPATQVADDPYYEPEETGIPEDDPYYNGGEEEEDPSNPSDDGEESGEEGSGEEEGEGEGGEEEEEPYTPVPTRSTAAAAAVKEKAAEADEEVEVVVAAADEGEDDKDEGADTGEEEVAVEEGEDGEEDEMRIMTRMVHPLVKVLREGYGSLAKPRDGLLWLLVCSVCWQLGAR
ncbi:hypothetical protein V8F06_005639 [Rhypophila decipiens]